MIAQKKFSPWISVALIMQFIFSSGCGGSSQPQNQATSTARAKHMIGLATKMAGQALETRTKQSQNTKATADAIRILRQSAQDWPEVIYDRFNKNEIDWPEGEKTGSLADIKWNFTNGRFRWEALAKDNFIWWAYPDMDILSNYYLSVEVQQLNGPENGEHGLVYHHSGDRQYYTFEINEYGQTGVFLHINDEWIALIDWKEHPSIRLGEVNKLSLIAQDSLFQFFINDEHIGTIHDERLVEGYVGLIIGLTNVDEQAVWEFDNFILRSPNTSDGDTALNK